MVLRHVSQIGVFGSVRIAASITGSLSLVRAHASIRPYRRRYQEAAVVVVARASIRDEVLGRVAVKHNTDGVRIRRDFRWDDECLGQDDAAVRSS